MSSHRRRVKHFSRKSGPRKALLRGLLNALVDNERISTTVDRAKEVRRHVEKAITLGKKGDLATRRLLLSRYPNYEIVKKIVDDLSVRFKSRPGGYTRVIKIGRRPGDTAEMAFIEFVDYDYAKFIKNDNKKSDKASADGIKKDTKVKKTTSKAVAQKRKSARKSQQMARVSSR